MRDQRFKHVADMLILRKGDIIRAVNHDDSSPRTYLLLRDAQLNTINSLLADLELQPLDGVTKHPFLYRVYRNPDQLSVHKRKYFVLRRTS